MISANTNIDLLIKEYYNMKEVDKQDLYIELKHQVYLTVKYLVKARYYKNLKDEIQDKIIIDVSNQFVELIRDETIIKKSYQKLCKIIKSYNSLAITKNELSINKRIKRCLHNLEEYDKSELIKDLDSLLNQNIIDRDEYEILYECLVNELDCRKLSKEIGISKTRFNTYIIELLEIFIENYSCY